MQALEITVEPLRPVVRRRKRDRVVPRIGDVDERLKDSFLDLRFARFGVCHFGHVPPISCFFSFSSQPSIFSMRFWHLACPSLSSFTLSMCPELPPRKHSRMIFSRAGIQAAKILLFAIALS